MRSCARDIHAGGGVERPDDRVRMPAVSDRCRDYGKRERLSAFAAAPSAALTPVRAARTTTMPPTAAAAIGAASGQAAPLAAPSVYCYAGPGAGTRSVLSTLHSLREALVPSVKVASLETAELLAGGWRDGCLLLVMPGGADLPYCRALNGRGNQLIREFVEGGGAYLGLCAGAYYACARVEFEPGSRLEVVGDRELAFFPGTAAGSIYSGFQYESEAGAVAAPLRFRCLESGGAAGEQAAAAVGSSGKAAADRGAGQLEGQPAGSGGGAAQLLQQGEQQLLQGEQQAADWQECVDYVNGGPSFQLSDGSPLAPLLLSRQSSQQQGQQQQDQQQQDNQQLAGVELLATYPEKDDAAAALLCRVGANGGHAVLCSTHPELHPSWLSGLAPPLASNGHPAERASSSGPGSGGNGSKEGSQQPQAVPIEASAAAAVSDHVDGQPQTAANGAAATAEFDTEAHVRGVQAALWEGRRQRLRFWRSLLVAAGLQPWMLPPPVER